MKSLIVVMVFVMACAAVSSAPSATPTESNAVAPTARATPTPTATVAAGLTRYLNSELGYSVDLPAGWRRATCSQGIATTSPLEAGEFFTSAPEAEEVISGGVRLVAVRVVEAAGLTPLAWLEQNAFQPDAHFEPVTLNGRSGARGFIGATGATYGFAVAARGWIYAIDWPYFGGPDAELEGIIATLRLLDDATVGRGPIATPVPRSIESLVDSLVDAFARKDLAALSGLMAPCVTVGAVPGDPDMRSRTAYVTTVAADFAASASVQVQARPIETDPYFGRFVRSTWSRPGQPDQRVDLMLRADGDRWSVGAVLIRASVN
jgi:hypothetical protein